MLRVYQCLAELVNETLKHHRLPPRVLAGWLETASAGRYISAEASVFGDTLCCSGFDSSMGVPPRESRTAP